ncbi:hypothetical protein FisN_28Lh025 [Fistulifera solaris]|uniref:subtilisin n=1 Tax=Fistulifera solaris TaxID=1519565 RepID=A0A1Z5KSB2_FISSO|nr:hypothetical protein FisN_28Lh025 [Fistulifera solaris]|eukprot:GAX29196.1 hypothetical protein FisN_28Lh025 [Fistulifera solaris]
MFYQQFFFLATSIAFLFQATYATDIPGQYIVYYKEDADRIATNQRLFSSSESASSESVRVVYELEKGIVVAGVTDEQHQLLMQDKAVERVVPDFYVTIDAVQRNPPNWGLDRIDQNSLPLNQTYIFNYNGTGVRVYIVDTGIRASHTNFEGRVTCGFSYFGSTCGDTQGHGTHVAGIVGGLTVGVAKKVQLMDVKVFGNDRLTSFSAIRAGFDYIIAEKRANPTIPMVINLSLGTVGVKPEYEVAINEAVAANIVVVVAAGNNASDSCQNSPSYVKNAITVGATDELDLRANFSNYGACVDLYAPGVSIVSTYIYGDTSGARLSGTSMAAPHVAGVAALFLERNPTWTPAQVWTAMKADARRAIALIWWPVRQFLKFRTTTRLLLQTDTI